MALLKTFLVSATFAALVAYYLTRQSSLVTPTLDEAYDYIIVGAGTAGSVLAARLSENPDNKVLLVEAGGEEIHNPLISMPLASPLLMMSDIDWQYFTVPQKHSTGFVQDNRAYWPRGKVIGGTGMLNFMMYTRGSRHDYDDWAANGCDGWSYEDVLPYFLKSEDILIEELSSSAYHHKGGPIGVSDARGTVLSDRLLAAGRELGYDIVDYNGADQEGFSVLQSTVRNGQRSSSGSEYLRPAMTRDNLHVAINTHVTKVLVDGNRATGVEFIRNLRKGKVFARKEVIMSAGAIGTPHILMLSGIGPKQHLESFNINVIADLPVGQNLQDHLFTMIPSFINASDSLTANKAQSLASILQYSVFHSGYLSATGSEGQIFLNSRKDSGQKYCDLQISMFTGLPALSDLKVKTKPTKVLLPDETGEEGIVLLPMLLHPKSRGNITLTSTDPFDHPAIEPQYLAHEDDVKTIIKGVRFVEQIYSTDIFRKMGVSFDRLKIEMCSDYEFRTDEFWECYIRSLASTAYHPTSTCKMGSLVSGDTVVDPTLGVKGIDGLRVVDASVIPASVSGNINAPVIMIAEKAADLILGKDTVEDIRARLRKLHHGPSVE